MNEYNSHDEKNNHQLSGSLFSLLSELRYRLIVTFLIIIFIFLFLCCKPGVTIVYEKLMVPLLHCVSNEKKVLATNFSSIFLIPIKSTFLLSFFISIPIIFYHFWVFVSPALYKKEKKTLFILITLSSCLFFIGMMFCYLIVLPSVLNFFLSIVPDSVKFFPDIESHFRFITRLTIIFGLMFQLPIVVIALISMKIFSINALRKARKHVIVGSFFIAAILTPPDLFSQFFLAIPMYLLYEVGLILGGCYFKLS